MARTTKTEIHPTTISKAQAGDACALNFIIQSYVPLIHWFALKTCRGYNLWVWQDDMFSYALSKIPLAIKTYNPLKGSLNNWVTYYIRGALCTFRKSHKYDCLNDDISLYADILIDDTDGANMCQVEYVDEVSSLLLHSNLSARDLKIVKLRFLSDLLLDDIKDIYHLTREGARQVLERAKVSLAKSGKDLDIGYIP